MGLIKNTIIKLLNMSKKNKTKNILQGYIKELYEDDKVIRIRNADSTEIRQLRIKNKNNKANAERTKKYIQEYIKTFQKVF